MTHNTTGAEPEPERGDTPIQEAALVTMEYLTRLGVRPAVPDEREAAALKVVAEYAYEHPRLLRWLDDLREAVEACAEALGAWEMSSKPSDPTIAQGLLRAGDKARRALASLDEQGGSDE